MTITTTAVAVLPAGTGGTWLVQNLGEAAIYLGRGDANASTGIEVSAEQAILIELGSGAASDLWAVTSGGTADVRVLRYR
jgi:hypothetical protein